MQREQKNDIFYDDTLNQSFRHAGFVIIDLLDAEDLVALRLVFDQVEQHHQGGFSTTILDADSHYRYTTHEKIAQIIRPRITSVINHYDLACCGFVVKQPSEDDGAMPLHQDITMVEDGPRPGMSIWAPLVAVDETNACLQLVPGSHRLYRSPRAPGTPFPCSALEAEIRARYLRALPLRAGQAILMDHATFHASEVNRSSAVRPVVACVLTPMEKSLVYYHRHHHENAALLEGFMVDADFYLRHRIGTRPHDAHSLGMVPEIIPTITSATLTTLPDPNLPVASLPY